MKFFLIEMLIYKYKIFSNPITFLDKDLKIVDDKPTPYENFVINESLDIVCNAVKLLPEKHQLAFLQAYNGNSYKEIAKNLGVPETTVKTDIHRARKMIRNSVKNQNLFNNVDNSINLL